MDDKNLADPLVDKLTKAVDDNLTNDQFGVEELATYVGMSRSQLHRKLSTATGQSVSQFIREHRLQRGMALLKEGTLTAAEVADRIGFGSATYFNKCFNQFYGFPPGEVKHKILAAIDEVDQHPTVNSATDQIRPTASLTKQSVRRIILATVGMVVLVVALIYLFGKLNAVKHPGKSIAILPFKNLSEDQRNEYFSEGVVEAIRTGLSQIKDLRVISRTSVEQYRVTSKSAREIAQELDVSTLLEGSIQRSNNQIRIEVRLIDGNSEAQVWAGRYDRELEDVFVIQKEIAQNVAAELNAKLSAEEKSRLSKSETDNPKAYDLYLKGIYEYRTYTNEGLHNAIALLSEAVEIDPNYARAYAFLANSYFGLATIFGAELSALEGFKKGKPFLDKALALDPDLDEARMLMGFYRLYNDWDFDGAEAEYKMAIARDHPDAIAVYADYLNFTLRHQDALQFAERLNELYPYYPNSRMVFSLIYNNRLDEALAFSEARLKIFNNYSTFDQHGFLLLNLKRYKESIVYFEKAIALEGIRYPRMLGWMGAAHAKSGDTKEALKIIDELKARLVRNDKGSIAFFTAVIYAALNEKETALSWLQVAYDSHDMEMPWLMTEPQFFDLYQEPGFKALAQKMGFK